MNQEVLKKIKNKGSLLAIHFIKSIPDLKKDEKNLYKYNGTHYDFYDEDSQRDDIYQFMEDNNIIESFKGNLIKDIILSLRSMPNIERVKMNEYNNLLNVRNGIVDLDNEELMPHSKDFNFSYILDVDYDKEAKDCPYFLSLLGDIFNDENDTIMNVCRIGGYLLYPQNKMEIMFFFLGDGANGKSILLEIYQLFFPPDNISSLTLQQLSKDTFMRSELLKSRVNIASETKGGKIDSEEIKKIVTGEPVTIDIKYSKPISFRPFTKIIIASNSRPYFNDTSHGIMRRLHIIEFKSTFMDKDQYNEEYNHKERRIFKKIPKDTIFKHINEEKSAIFNLFIKSLKNLKDMKFVLPESNNTKLIKTEYLEIADTLGTFLREYYEIDKDNTLNIKDILNHFHSIYTENFPDKKFNYSTKGMGKNVKSIFKVEPVYKVLKNRDGVREKSTMYPLKLKQFNLEDELQIN